MRASTMILVSAAAILAPALTSADAGQAKSEPSAHTAPAPITTVQVTATARVDDASSSGNPDEIVCHTIPPTTGTRLGGSRECQTSRYWNARRQASREALMHAQSLGMQQPLKDFGAEPPGHIAAPR